MKEIYSFFAVNFNNIPELKIANIISKLKDQVR